MRLSRITADGSGSRPPPSAGPRAGRGPRLEALRGQPALRLLVDRRPGRQVVRHEPPRGPGFDDVAQAVEHLAQVVVALAGVLAHQGQIGRDERPLFIADVGRVGWCDAHAGNDKQPQKFITRSRIAAATARAERPGAAGRPRPGKAVSGHRRGGGAATGLIRGVACASPQRGAVRVGQLRLRQGDGSASWPVGETNKCWPATSSMVLLGSWPSRRASSAMTQVPGTRADRSEPLPNENSPRIFGRRVQLLGGRAPPTPPARPADLQTSNPRQCVREQFFDISPSGTGECSARGPQAGRPSHGPGIEGRQDPRGRPRRARRADWCSSAG